MNTYRNLNCRNQAFTLIELLVVIGIIALLASIAIPAGNIVLDKARNTQAKAAMKGLEVGIKGYQTEYNKYPANATYTDSQAIELVDGNELMQAITIHGAQTAASKLVNPRALSFYDPSPAQKNRNGYTPGGGLMDPWGEPYIVAIDYNGDNEVTIPSEAAGTDDPATLAVGVVAYSTGKPPHDPIRNFVRSWR